MILDWANAGQGIGARRRGSGILLEKVAPRQGDHMIGGHPKAGGDT